MKLFIWLTSVAFIADNLVAAGAYDVFVNTLFGDDDYPSIPDWKPALPTTPPSKHQTRDSEPGNAATIGEKTINPTTVEVTTTPATVRMTTAPTTTRTTTASITKTITTTPTAEVTSTTTARPERSTTTTTMTRTTNPTTTYPDNIKITTTATVRKQVATPSEPTKPNTNLLPTLPEDRNKGDKVKTEFEFNDQDSAQELNPQETTTIYDEVYQWCSKNKTVIAIAVGCVLSTIVFVLTALTIITKKRNANTNEVQATNQAI